MADDHWWRAYDNSIDHPKLLKLSDAMHRAWFTLQCIASANGGIFPAVADIALRLRMKPEKVGEWISKLVLAELIDNDDGTFRPHNWGTRQYQTDAADPSGARRQKKHRDNKRDELKQLRALRDSTRASLRNTVTPVSVKRPDTDTDITPTASVERKGLGNGTMTLSSEALAIGRRG